MNKEDNFKEIQKTWKIENTYLKEVYSPKEILEYECYFRLRINADKTQSTLEDVLIYVRGINGVTIVRSGETTKRNEANQYSTRLYVKYTPQTFNKDVSLEQAYLFLEKEIRNFGAAVSLTRLTPPPGELVTGKGKFDK